MWWCWVPLQFDDFAMHVILEEDPDGVRNTNFAVRMWPADANRPVEQFGWPLPQISYRSGTRIPTHASMALTDRSGRVANLEIEPIIGIPLNVGCGYNGDPDWAHGSYKGETWVEGAEYDHQDPAVAGRLIFTITDHLARATFDGHEGWGIFEHGAIGPHKPTGFPDYTTGAP
jgi:hypothetical protein